MKVLTSIILALCVLHCTVAGAILPKKWDRLTCKVASDTLQGTGFLLRFEGEVFIVTNSHLADPGKSTFYINHKPVPADSINPEALEVDALTPPANMYFWDEQYDLAFVRITSTAPYMGITVIPESMIGDDTAIAVGQGVFFLGYPGGLHGHDSNTPLVRSGIIAGESEHAIILDGNVFGGSSGSPVFLDPSLDGDHINATLLIGVISQLKTAPTKSHREVRENMGIGYAIKIRYVRDVIRRWLSSH